MQGATISLTFSTNHENYRINKLFRIDDADRWKCRFGWFLVNDS